MKPYFKKMADEDDHNSLRNELTFLKESMNNLINRAEENEHIIYRGNIKTKYIQNADEKNRAKKTIKNLREQILELEFFLNKHKWRARK